MGKSQMILGGKIRNMTKRKYKEERKKILEKYGIPMSQIPDEELKDKNGCWIWLREGTR